MAAAGHSPPSAPHQSNPARAKKKAEDHTISEVNDDNAVSKMPSGSRTNGTGWRPRCARVVVIVGSIFLAVAVPALCIGEYCTRGKWVLACLTGRHVDTQQDMRTSKAVCGGGNEAFPTCDEIEQRQDRSKTPGTTSFLFYRQHSQPGADDPNRPREDEEQDTGLATTDARALADSARGGGKGGWGWLHPGRRAKRKRILEKAVRRADAKRISLQGNGKEGVDRLDGALPTGLANQGNTCYLNSLLQTMYHAPELKEAVLAAAEGEGWGEDAATLAALAEVFKQLDDGGRPASTMSLTTAMGVDPRIQQDAQEFGRFLFMALEGEGSENNKNRENKCGVLAERIHELFAGRLVNYIECVNVPFSKQGEEVFYDLPLDVSGSRSLQKSLDRFTEAELLQGENRWRAGDHGLQDARKGVRFVEFPPVLQFHLKRFQYDPNRDDLAKVNDYFEFPTEVDMSPWVSKSAIGRFADNSSSASLPSHDADAAAGPSLLSPNNKGRRNCYALSAIVMHVGGPSVGHYYAYVRKKRRSSPSSLAPRWVKLDDSRVTEVSEDEVLRDAYGGQGGGGGLFGRGGGGGTASAYMLQYVREDPPVITSVNEESANPQP